MNLAAESAELERDKIRHKDRIEVGRLPLNSLYRVHVPAKREGDEQLYLDTTAEFRPFFMNPVEPSTRNI